MSLLKPLFYFILLIFSIQDAFTQEEENDSIVFYRENWFYRQRQFPQDSIPRNAYSNAIHDKENLDSNQGYLFDIPYRWNNIGPRPISNAWDGYNSGRGSTIKFDPNNIYGNTIFLGAANGGVWKTIDGGSNWVPISDFIGSISSGALAIKPGIGNSNVIYYGTGEAVLGIIYSYEGRGIYKTTDGGESWKQLGGGLPTSGTRVFEIIINPINPNIVLAAMNSGLWRSSDEGANWTRVTGSTDLICTDVVISLIDPNRVYCAGPSSINGGVGYRKSTDGGATFTVVNDPVFQPIGRTELAITGTTNDIVYATTNRPLIDPPSLSNYMKIFKSTDGSGTNFFEATCLHEGFDQVEYDLFLEASPHDENLLFAGVLHLFRSIEGGSNLKYLAGYSICGRDGGECCATQFWRSNMHPDFHTLAFHPTVLGQIAVLNDGGVWTSSDNGTTWDNKNYTLSTTLIYDFESFKNDKEFIISGVQDMGFIKKQSNSSNWNMMFSGGDGGKVLVSKFNNKKMIIVGNLYGDIKQTTNSWDPWSPGSLDVETTWEPRDGDWVAPLAEHPTQDFVLYTARRNKIGGINVFQSNNGGINWNTISIINGLSIPPQDLVISPNGNIMYLTASTFDKNLAIPTELFKSTNGGANWTRKFIIDNGIPKRYITDIQIDPVNSEIVYLTLSGMGTSGQNGHVFKSINGGNSWSDISGNLSESAPVNNIVVYYWGPGVNDKRYIVAADNGVFTSNDQGITWGPVAAGLPNTIYNDLELHELSGYLRTSSYGRGMFEINFETPLFINNDYLLSNNQGDINIERDIHITANNKLTVLNNTTLKLASGKKIIVEDGGQIDISSGATVTFTSQSGEWGGIEFQGSSYGTLKNCTFTNTSTPIVINSTAIAFTPPPQILIENCTFNQPIEITGRQNVSVKYNTWSIGSSGSDAVVGAWSDNVLIQGNNINYTSQVSGSHGIELAQCNNSTVTQNTVSNADYPITVSNGTYYIRYSSINTNYPTTSVIGITLNGVNNGHLIGNNVTGYQTAFWLDAQSSPTVLQNNADATNANGDKTVIYCYNGSSPRIRPTMDGLSGVIWDAGLNTFINKGTGSYGLYVSDNSMPDLDYGYNTVYGEGYNIAGSDFPNSEWYVRCNNWDRDPPNFQLNGTDFYYEPFGCSPPGGGAKSGDGTNTHESENTEPPQPLIVNYGNGLIDTFHVSSFNGTVYADQELYGNAQKEIYLGNFQSAIDKFKQVVQNYRDSSTAIQSLNRIFYCYNRLNSDTTAYNSLKNYYINLANQNLTDTVFSKTAMELSRKCLIRKQDYVDAIGEYENVIQNSQDSSDIIPAEISIIEVYILLNTGSGDAPSFTGQLGYLKPSGLRDALSRIREKMKHLSSISANVEIPKVFSLSQNYPNPFNPVTKINYSLPNAVSVNLKVYDILGRLVKTLVNEYKPAGNYSVSFDGSSLASGVYFYRIEAGDYVDSKKMVLVK